jgi:hypothetical protein
MAFAMAGVPTVLPHEKFVLTANWGNFEGENGFSALGAMRLGPNLQLNGGVAAGTSGNTFGSRVGVRVGW